MKENKEQSVNEKDLSFVKRFFIYLKERFPLGAYGIYVLAIVLATFKIVNNLNGKFTVFHSAKPLDSTGTAPAYVISSYGIANPIIFYTIIPMFIFAFLIFFMVRISDEFKDFKEDSKYRPYRPVPRGLISLRTLGILFVISLLIQIAIQFICKGSIFAFLLVFFVFGLLTLDFFMPKFLSKHKIISLVFDELLMPFLVVYISTLTLLEVYPSGGQGITNVAEDFKYIINDKPYIIFLLFTYFGSWIMEVARKIRCKECEENGVKTYTAVFGIKKATLFLSVIETIIFALFTIIIVITTFISFYNPMMFNRKVISIIYAISLIGYIALMIVNLNFTKKQTHKLSKMVEYLGYTEVLVLYFLISLVF